MSCQFLPQRSTMQHPSSGITDFIGHQAAMSPEIAQEVAPCLPFFL
jgi:hypothetical protein